MTQTNESPEQPARFTCRHRRVRWQQIFLKRRTCQRSSARHPLPSPIRETNSLRNELATRRAGVLFRIGKARWAAMTPERGSLLKLAWVSAVPLPRGQQSRAGRASIPDRSGSTGIYPWMRPRDLGSIKWPRVGTRDKDLLTSVLSVQLTRQGSLDFPMPWRLRRFRFPSASAPPKKALFFLSALSAIVCMAATRSATPLASKKLRVLIAISRRSVCSSSARSSGSLISQRAPGKSHTVGAIPSACAWRQCRCKLSTPYCAEKFCNGRHASKLVTAATTIARHRHCMLGSVAMSAQKFGNILPMQHRQIAMHHQ